MLDVVVDPAQPHTVVPDQATTERHRCGSIQRWSRTRWGKDAGGSGRGGVEEDGKGGSRQRGEGAAVAVLQAAAQIAVDRDGGVHGRGRWRQHLRRRQQYQGRGIGRGSRGGLIGANNSEGDGQSGRHDRRQSEEDDRFGKAEKISEQGMVLTDQSA